MEPAPNRIQSGKIKIFYSKYIFLTIEEIGLIFAILQLTVLFIAYPALLKTIWSLLTEKFGTGGLLVGVTVTGMNAITQLIYNTAFYFIYHTKSSFFEQYRA